jgi:hypothetical protein
MLQQWARRTAAVCAALLAATAAAGSDRTARSNISWCGMVMPPTLASASAGSGGYGGRGFDKPAAADVATPPRTQDGPALRVSPGRSPYTDERVGELLLRWD